MANVFTYINIKEASRRHKIVKLHKLCCKGTAQKPVFKAFKEISQRIKHGSSDPVCPTENILTVIACTKLLQEKRKYK